MPVSPVTTLRIFRSGHGGWGTAVAMLGSPVTTLHIFGSGHGGWGTAVEMPGSPVTTLNIFGSGHGGWGHSSCNAWVSCDHPPYIWVWSWRMGAQQLQCLGLL